VVLAKVSRKKQQQKQKSHNVNVTGQHSTFFVQTLFFLLVMFENILLAAWPLIRGNSNRALACLGAEKLVEYVGVIVCLCLGSWICHILYYKYMGHPWTEINGPSITRHKIEFNLHWCGTEQILTCKCCSQRNRRSGSDPAENPEENINLNDDGKYCNCCCQLICHEVHESDFVKC
jgi:hypothetical protein